MKSFDAKARLNQKMIFSHENGDVVLDRRTALTFLHKNTKGEYVFCVKKLHGTGQSAVILNKDEFKWLINIV